MEIEYIDYPWYFEPNKILECWAITTGQGVITDLIDTCVDFSTTPLFEKNVGTVNCNKEISEAAEMHGTAMAGLIAATHTKLPNKNDQSKLVTISGIAPDSLIRNDLHTLTAESVETTISKQKEVPITKSGISVLKTAEDRERPQLILINLSGGGKTETAAERTHWNEIISKICKDDKDEALAKLFAVEPTYSSFSKI